LLVNGVLQIHAYQHNEKIGGRPPANLRYHEIPAFREMIERESGFVVRDMQKESALTTAIMTHIEPEFLSLASSVHSFMAAPMVIRNTGMGMLAVASTKPGIYDQASLNLIQVFANQAAIAIENARLYEQAQAAAALEERTRLARELHDSATQSLYSATLISEAGKELAEEGDQESAGYHLTRVSELVQQALKDMRLLVFQLRPPVLEEEGLVMALQHRIDAVEKRAGMEVRLITDGLPLLSDPMKDQLYSIATEALNNVLKHAQADKAMIIINSDEANLSLEVHDDGQGFDPQVANNGGGMGLLNMAERAAELDADLTISSSPGEGTCIRVCAPLKTTVSKTDQDEETS
jgi:signal transduction histidine kinase